MLCVQMYSAAQPYTTQAGQSQQVPYMTSAPAPYNPNFAFQPSTASGFAAADNRYSCCVGGLV